MSLKTKLISTISAICMVLALLTVGVWAVGTASVTLGGSVSFTADNVHARITGSVTGTQETISLPNLEYDVNTDVNATAFQEKLSSWANNDMTFTSENLITMTITVENLSEERSLFVTLTDNTTTDNVSKTLKQGVLDYTSATAVELTAGASTIFTMTLSVTDKNQSASATVSYQVDLRDANVEGPIVLKRDSSHRYYYVEMGTYNDAPVRWKVIGVNGQPYTYDPNTAPTGELTFLQETKTTGIQYSLMPLGPLNSDYSTGIIRQYLTGHECALDENGQKVRYKKYDEEGNYCEEGTPIGNYLEDINIDPATDKIYSKIKARSITDLYTDINWDGNSIISDGTPKVADKTEEDKLWILSIAEIYSLVKGGDISSISGPGISGFFEESFPYFMTDNSFNWDSEIYYLRTPFSYTGPSLSDDSVQEVYNNVFVVMESDINQGGAFDTPNPVRAAFVLNV